jgi:hypothetical protein
MNLYKNNWQEFKISDVFTISRGKRLVEIDRAKGDIEYYSASDYNNGLTDRIANPLFIERNSLIYTTFGKCFYVEGKFTASDEISILKHNKLNIYNGLFLATLITQNKYKYSFGRKAFKNKFSQDIIKLPVLKKDLIDWNFMENYIKKLSININYDNKIIKNNVLNIKNEKFKEFNLFDLFNVRGSKSSFVQNEISFGEYLYVTTSNKNNGVAGTSNIYTEEGNVITIDSATDGKAFYQESRFVGSDHVEILEPINFELNKYIALFFVSILNLQIFRYSFGRKRSQTRIRKEKLFLPIDKNGDPDFKYMENYIKTLNYSQSL